MSGSAFVPLELNEENIHALFRYCLADENSAEVVENCAYRRSHGFNEDSETVRFDLARLEESYSAIRYLLGQIKRDASPYVKMGSYIRRYDGVQWAANSAMQELVMLGSAVRGGESYTLTSPIFQSHDAVRFLGEIPPTLSPADPTFADWWAAHGSEWA